MSQLPFKEIAIAAAVALVSVSTPSFSQNITGTQLMNAFMDAFKSGSSEAVSNSQIASDASNNGSLQGEVVTDSQPGVVRQHNCDTGQGLGECRRNGKADYSARGLQDGAILRFNTDRRYFKPQEAADRTCRTAASFPILRGEPCQEFLKPYVEADIKKEEEEAAERIKQAEVRKQKALEEERKRFADPQKSADALAAAEKRFADAVVALKKSQPAMRNNKLEPMSALAKSWCQGVVNDSKYPSGSTEARMILTDCYTGYINSAADQVEAAAKNTPTTLLR